MQPWMIIAIVIALGFLVLLVAPTLHRRSISKSRTEASARKRSRAASFRTEATTEEHQVASAVQAVRARDLLMLRGVRSEVIATEQPVVLLAAQADRETVLEVMDSLG